MIANTSSIFCSFLWWWERGFQKLLLDHSNLSRGLPEYEFAKRVGKYFVISKLSRKNNKIFAVPVRCHNASQNTPQFGRSQYYHSKSLLVTLDRQTDRSDQIRSDLIFLSASLQTNEWFEMSSNNRSDTSIVFEIMNKALILTKLSLAYNEST